MRLQFQKCASGDYWRLILHLLSSVYIQTFGHYSYCLHVRSRKVDGAGTDGMSGTTVVSLP